MGIMVDRKNTNCAMVAMLTDLFWGCCFTLLLYNVCCGRCGFDGSPWARMCLMQALVFVVCYLKNNVLDFLKAWEKTDLLEQRIPNFNQACWVPQCWLCYHTFFVMNCSSHRHENHGYAGPGVERTRLLFFVCLCASSKNRCTSMAMLTGCW